MPRAGGVYTLPAGNPVVTLTVISSGWANTTMSDIATALTGSLPTDGSAPMTGVLRLVDGAVGAPGLTFAAETISGLYRIGAGDFGFSVASTKKLEITAAVPLALFGTAPGIILNADGGITSGYSRFTGIVTLGTSGNDYPYVGYNVAATTSSGVGNYIIADFASRIRFFGGGFQLQVAGGGVGGNPIAFSSALTVGSAGNVTVAAPGSGVALTVTGIANQYTALFVGSSTASQSAGIRVTAGTNSGDTCSLFQNQAGNVNYLTINGDGGVTVGSPTGSNQGLGTINATGLFVNGVAGAPQNLQSVNYQFVLADAGKHILQNAAGGHTYTIPANGTVAFPIGTIITIVNGVVASPMTLNITTDTLVFAPSGATGPRTLSAGAVATLIKTAATTWYITGVGVT